MKLRNILIIALVIVFGGLTAQVSTLETKGTKYYNNFTYSKAIKKYEEVGVEGLTTVGLRNLADAYRYTHNSQKAEEYYKVLVSKSDNKAEDLLVYAEMLEMNKKHAEYEQWMDKFHARLVTDGRGKEYAAKKGTYQKLKLDNGQFEIKHLDINTDKEDFGPSFYGDKVVFASSRNNNFPIKRIWNWNKFPFLNLYVADLTDDKKLDGVKRMSKKINKKYHEGPASFSKDETLMVFTRNNYEDKAKDGERKLKMFYREKDEDGDWGKIMPFDFNNKEYSVGHPALTADGKTLYFVSNMPGGQGGTDLYKVERKGEGWSSPQNLGSKINTEGNEMFPFYHEEGMLFFASEGHVGLGGMDVFMSKVEGSSYGDIKNLGAPLNTEKDDFALILDKDQKYGFFSSNRDGGNGSDDIYAFNLLKPFAFCKEIKGLAVDKSNNVIQGAEVNLYDSKGAVVETVTVGDDGAYSFCVEPGSYSLNGSKSKYFDGKNTANPTEDSDVITANVVLEKDPGFSLYALVTNKKTGTPLEGVTVTLVNKLTGKSEVIMTPVAGDFKRPIIGKKLMDNISYELKLEKGGYMTKTVLFTKQLTKPGQQDVHANLDLGLNPLEVGGDLSKLIEINPIYFDLNKSFIRPDAALELDKIVKVMNEYPQMHIELGSHTDCRASRKYNEKLSDRRAKSSAKYIASKITNPNRIQGKGYGEEKLINHCECEGRKKVPCTEEEHQVNRRTEFKITKFDVKGVKAKANGPQSFDK